MRKGFTNIYDYDISFCKGIDSEGKECSKKDKCHRYWTDLTAKQADKLGLKFFSFITPTDVNKCTMFMK